MENNVLLNRRKKTREKAIFIVLCVFIALIIIANITAFSLAYFTDQKSSSISLVMGNVNVVGKVKDGNNYTNSPLTLSDSIVFPGSTTDQYIQLQNTGNVSFYLRLSCTFKLYINSAWATSNLLEIDSITMPNGSTYGFDETTNGNVFYYLGTFASNETISDIKVTFKVSESLGNSDLLNTQNYQHLQYKILLNVDVIQVANLSLTMTSADTMAAGWPS